MATIRPFAALRPPRQYAEQVSCLPYDVMNHDEACRMAAGNVSSYLHICRADIDTSESQIHDEVNSSAAVFSCAMRLPVITSTVKSCGDACKRAS